MDDIMHPAPMTPAEAAAILDDYIAKIQEMNKEIEQSQAESAKVRARSEELKVQIQGQKARTRAVLSELGIEL